MNEVGDLRSNLLQEYGFYLLLNSPLFFSLSLSLHPPPPPSCLWRDLRGRLGVQIHLVFTLSRLSTTLIRCAFAYILIVVCP